MKTTRRDFLKTTGAAVTGAALLSALPDEARSEEAASAPSRPNILFLFPDEHRFDWLGSNPAIPIKTPNLDKLCARGVRFTRAFTPSPLCAPARACLSSGREYDRCRVPANSVNYPDDQMTFYKLLRESGYHTMGCGKFDLHKGAHDWGADGKRKLDVWGFSDGIDSAGKGDGSAAARTGKPEPYTLFLKSRGLLETHLEDFKKRRDGDGHGTFPTPLPDDAYDDNWIASNGLELIRRAPSGKPWFLQVNFTGPHPPWDITESMTKLYADVEFPQPNKGTGLTPERHNEIRRNYAAMITNIDRLCGLFIDELAKRGELENTIVVYSSDHGEMLGDHGHWGKSVPFQPSVGVPLICAGPGAKAGLVSDALTTITDIAATCLDYGGVPRPGDMDSLSLRPVIEGREKVHREAVFSALAKFRMTFDGRVKTIYGFRGERELKVFDLVEDPLENTDLVKQGEANVSNG